jgi:hypothetical protein
MTKKKQTSRPKQNIPEITLQPKQLEFANANQSIVFFGGGAKPNLVPL